MTGPLNPTVAHLLDASRSNPSSANKDLSDSDDDALISALENSPTLGPLREQRVAELTEELSRAKHLRGLAHGTYMTLDAEKPLMDITTSTEKCVVHFFHPDFARCGAMDGHLEALAVPHYEARFLRIDVARAPFLVEKLGVRVLPCVMAFVDGKVVDRVVGFEGVSRARNGDGCSTGDMEARLVRSGVLERTKGVGSGGDSSGRNIRATETEADDEDDEWD
ncbi:hypothetical protein MMC20_006731 [Loxospora ochrophaea]|nr:hypothetical protein [Loxospora ochrophaea]